MTPKLNYFYHFAKQNIYSTFTFKSKFLLIIFQTDLTKNDQKSFFCELSVSTQIQILKPHFIALNAFQKPKYTIKELY